ncbi:DUF2218 domain-containing protein [Neotabrizicola sp. VNH66]|uniref:DUF2218 domain-containing protein n=1 Tax=Neotabrizicola sp. VNH66 TaxID=3400918 RepID=UPI003C059CC0
MRSTARYPTQHASKYMQQLLKHFAHKVEVQYDETHGTAALMTGPAELWADAEGLTVTVTGEDAKAVIQARYTIDSHLVTFAHRENFTGLSWTVDPA